MDFKEEWKMLYTRMKFDPDQLDSVCPKVCLIIVALFLAPIALGVIDGVLHEIFSIFSDMFTAILAVGRR